MGQNASGGLVKCCQTPMAATVQQTDAGIRPISIKPTPERRERKSRRKKVSALETSAFDPEANDLRLTPSKRKLILLREYGDENSSDNRLKKPAIDAEEAQEMLCRGCTRGEIKAIHRALVSGASASAPNLRGMTPLMQCACAQGSTVVEAMKLLIEHGAPVESVDKNGWNALHHACRSGKSASAKYLLSICADPGLVARDKLKTPLMLAAEDGKVDVVAHLVKDISKSGIDVAKLNSQDANGWTALHCAMKCGSKDIANLLLDQGAKTRVKSSEGQEPLMVACEHGKLDCAKLLFHKGGIDVNSQDHQKQSALLVACLNRYEDVAYWLVKKCKADKFLEDIHGQSPISIARQTGLSKALGSMVRKEEFDGDNDTA